MHSIQQQAEMFGQGGMTMTEVAEGTGILEVVLTHDASGKITGKAERCGCVRHAYNYEYDADGRLSAAYHNGKLAESYTYNASGQRVGDYCVWRGGERRFAYGSKGELLTAGPIRHYYDEAGTLRCRQKNRESLYCFYGDDTRMDSAQLPNGGRVQYQYGPMLGPVATYLNGELAESFVWRDAVRLNVYHDHLRGMSYHFIYGAHRMPQSVTVVDNAPDMFTGESKRETATYQLGYDQVGTLKVVASQSGELIKEMEYDSFGTVVRDSNEWFYMPLGFAGGLPDRYTGLVRFGYRDYDPETGRFTAQDPLGDTGGDHDLWDYCVDDPVNGVDPYGLLVFLLPFAAGTALATGIAGLGSWGASALAGKLNGSGDKAVKETKEQFGNAAKINGGIVAGFALPEAGAAALKYGPAAAELVAKGGKAAMKATEATANTAGNFIKAKGLDVANKVMGNPAALAAAIERGKDMAIGAAYPEIPAANIWEQIGSSGREVYNKLIQNPKAHEVVLEKKAEK